MATLSGAVAVVTGGTRGIGRAVAVRLLGLGAKVTITARHADHVVQTARELSQSGGECEGFACDVSDLGSVEELGAHVKQKHGRVDILVNNAGIGGPSAPLHELAVAEWDAIMNTNLRGVFYMIRTFAPMMISAGSGHIVNISSLAGKNPLPNGAAYSASKWGLNGLSYSLAEELRGHNIRVSVICPGSVNTRFTPRGHKSPEKMLQPEDVAHAVAAIVTQAPQSFISEILLRPTQKP